MPRRSSAITTDLKSRARLGGSQVPVDVNAVADGNMLRLAKFLGGRHNTFCIICRPQGDEKRLNLACRWTTKSLAFDDIDG
jgi:hypothetical protein